MININIFFSPPCFCLFVLDGGSVNVYLSLLLSCAPRVPQEKGKCVTEICSSMRFLFEARNTSHDFLKPNYNPVSAVTRGFSTSRGSNAVVCQENGTGHLGQSTRIISRAREAFGLGLPLDGWTSSEGSHADFKGTLFLGMRSMQIRTWSCGLKCLTAVTQGCLSFTVICGKKKKKSAVRMCDDSSHNQTGC